MQLAIKIWIWGKRGAFCTDLLYRNKEKRASPYILCLLYFCFYDCCFSSVIWCYSESSVLQNVINTNISCLLIPGESVQYLLLVVDLFGFRIANYRLIYFYEDCTRESCPTVPTRAIIPVRATVPVWTTVATDSLTDLVVRRTSIYCVSMFWSRWLDAVTDRSPHCMWPWFF